MINSKWWALVVAAAALLGCGGGGGSAGTPPFGDGDGGASATADLVVTTSSVQIFNSGSSSATVTVTAVDSSRNALANVPVTVSADSGAIVTTSSTATDDEGTVQATVGIGADRSNRVIVVTATSGSISRSVSLLVTGTTVSATLSPAIVAPSAAGSVRYVVIDNAGAPMANMPIQVSAAGLSPSEATGTTSANGDFTFNFTAPTATGSYTIIGSVGGMTDSQTVQVQTASTVPAVSAAILSASVSANPNVVAVNTAGSDGNQTQVRALFLGANNQPVPNVRVRFDLAGDVNSIGGTFTTGSNTVYSNANGVATAAYTPGTRASPTDGLTIRACYGTSDTDPNFVNCTTFATTTVTITSEPLGVSIGTNELIITDNPLTYKKQFLVSVVDSAGVAKPDVNVAVSVDLPLYRKGSYAPGTSGTPGWAKFESIACANEDTNRNGVLEIIGGIEEDQDGDGRLDPGKSDVSVTLLQDKTGSDGTAVLEIQYARSFGTWVDVLITVSASGVSGTEGRASYLVAPVPVPTTALTNVQVAPAFIDSPYGLTGSCTNPN
ncbi:hypothetical protein BURC_01542 [Burkholderiaceae bacterium]|nr:hypothetical protein BURC_01542 [Burkholderiaceae bacterium]